MNKYNCYEFGQVSVRNVRKPKIEILACKEKLLYTWSLYSCLNFDFITR